MISDLIHQDFINQPVDLNQEFNQQGLLAMQSGSLGEDNYRSLELLNAMQDDQF